jgi:predicted Zn-dependent peptidase
MEFKKKVLGNGLTILHEKRDVPVTTVMLAVKYGAEYESAEEKGIAHFIEHLCFKGTEKRTAKEIAGEVEKLGGDLNAFTHEEITAYHVKIPSEHLGVAMDVIFDIFFNASFPEEEVQKEGNVICEEIKMYRDNPRAHVLDQIKDSLYKSPFGMFIAGTQETVRGISRKKLFEKHRSLYVPKNSILCVVGNNEFEDVLKLANSLVVERKGVEGVSPKINLRIAQNKEKRGDVHQTNLALGFHFPKLSEKKRYAAEVFSAILGEGLSSRLVTEVREKRGLVYAIKTELDLGRNYGYMVLWAGTDPSKSDEVISVSLEEFSKMKNITQKELDDAKVQVIGNSKIESESSRDVAMNLILEEISGDARKYYDYEKNIMAVTLADIRSLADTTEFSSFSLGP